MQHNIVNYKRYVREQLPICIFKFKIILLLSKTVIQLSFMQIGKSTLIRDQSISAPHD